VSSSACLPAGSLPEGCGPAGLLLTHGAGSDRTHHTSLALEAGLDLPVRRIDFPYRRIGGRRPPDPAPRLIDCIAEESAAFAAELGVGTERIVCGGRSLGGRMCSMAAAGSLPTAGVVCLSYPLHPPRRPDKLRVDHFGDIRAALLMINGDRDPFGSPEEFHRELKAIRAPLELHWLPGQGHNPKPQFDEVIVETVRRFIAGLG